MKGTFRSKFKRNAFFFIILSASIISFYGYSFTNFSIGLKSYIQEEDCTFDGFKLYGKIQFVESFPDLKVQVVESFPDLKVKIVDSFPDECGEWQIVDSFPDLKVKIVESFPDIKIKFVESFPGLL
jgi:hypothetical protein